MFQQSVAVDPTGVFADNAAYYVGRTDYELGDLAGATATLSSFIGAHAESSYLDNARYYLGRSYFDGGSYPQAIDALAAVSQTAGSSYLDDAAYYSARAQYALGRLPEADTGFAALVATSPPGQYADNALYYELRIAVDSADCASAQQRAAELEQRFPASTYVALGASYMTNAGC
jgi:TolA-binding protein